MSDKDLDILPQISKTQKCTHFQSGHFLFISPCHFLWDWRKQLCLYLSGAIRSISSFSLPGLKWAKKEKTTVLSLCLRRLVSLCYTQMGFKLVHYGTQSQSQNLAFSWRGHITGTELDFLIPIGSWTAGLPSIMFYMGRKWKLVQNQGLPVSPCGRGATMRSFWCNCPLGPLSELLEHQALPLPIWMEEPESRWLVFDRVAFEFLKCVLTVV